MAAARAPRVRIAATIAATIGAADAALFIVRRPGLFRRKPRRALTNVAVFAAWTALASTTARQSAPRPATRALAVGLAGANLAMLGAHLAHRIATPRVFIGPAMSAIVLTDVMRSR